MGVRTSFIGWIAYYNNKRRRTKKEPVPVGNRAFFTSDGLAFMTRNSEQFKTSEMGRRYTSRFPGSTIESVIKWIREV